MDISSRRKAGLSFLRFVRRPGTRHEVVGLSAALLPKKRRKDNNNNNP
jgi:hypothetical protein